MFDTDDGDSARFFVDPVNDPVATAPSGVMTRQVTTERFTDSVWIVQERTVEKVGDGMGGFGRQGLGEGPTRGAVDT